MKLLARWRRQIRNTVTYLRIFRKHDDRRFKVLQTEQPNLVEAARYLHAATYLRRGFVLGDAPALLPGDLIKGNQ